MFSVRWRMFPTDNPLKYLSFFGVCYAEQKVWFYKKTFTVSNTCNVPCTWLFSTLRLRMLLSIATIIIFWLGSGETKTIATTIHALDGKEPKPLNVNVRYRNVE
jgi:hypothetical protein